ncbi:hypothetical protein Dimus_016774, partial [Dionaea muscipula]
SGASRGSDSWVWKSLLKVRDRFLPWVSNSRDVASFEGSLSYSVRQGYNALVGRVAT